MTYDFRGGPLSGMKLEGSLLRREGLHQPDRILIQYDPVCCKDNLELFPDTKFAAGAEAILAEYEFEPTDGSYGFHQWTVKRANVDEGS